MTSRKFGRFWTPLPLVSLTSRIGNINHIVTSRIVTLPRKTPSPSELNVIQKVVLTIRRKPSPPFYETYFDDDSQNFTLSLSLSHIHEFIIISRNKVLFSKKVFIIRDTIGYYSREKSSRSCLEAGCKYHWYGDTRTACSHRM
jgi:hypothetical protein